jgi:hypothetical protein
MLDLNVNKSRVLNFSIQLGGISPDQLVGTLTFMIDNLQLSIPTQIKENEITVNIPPLSTIIRRSFTEGEEIPAKLEAHGNSYYLNPWSDSFVVKNPVTMEVAVSEDIQTDIPEINVESISDDAATEEVEIIRDKSRDEEARERVNKKLDMINKLVDQALLNRKKIKSTKQKTTVENKVKKEKNNNLTEEYLIEYIKMFGSKNEHIQEIILDQAKLAASESGKSNDLDFVFRKIQEVLPRGKYT